MDGLEKKEKEAELLKVIRGSIPDARSTVQELEQVFKDNVYSLRVEAGDDAFLTLSQNIRDLQYLMNFIGELREGIGFFDAIDLPNDPVTHQDSGVRLFREMNSALETKDWIMLADLIEYELAPLLMKEDEWFSILDTKLAECAA